MDSVRRTGYAGIISDDLPHREYVRWQRAIIRQCLRILTDNWSLFYNINYRIRQGLLMDRRDIIRGFPVRQEIICSKGVGAAYLKNAFRPSYEVIFLICKQDFKPTKAGINFTDIWTIKPDRKNSHPAPFPVELARRCIASTDAKLVLDPFFGSGTTALEALQGGRDFIGIERADSYQTMSARRLRQAALKAGRNIKFTSTRI